VHFVTGQLEKKGYGLNGVSVVIDHQHASRHSLSYVLQRLGHVPPGTMPLRTTSTPGQVPPDHGVPLRGKTSRTNMLRCRTHSLIPQP
jgi:hypothetical protein